MTTATLEAPVRTPDPTAAHREDKPIKLSFVGGDLTQPRFRNLINYGKHSSPTFPDKVEPVPAFVIGMGNECVIPLEIKDSEITFPEGNPGQPKYKIYNPSEVACDLKLKRLSGDKCQIRWPATSTSEAFGLRIRLTVEKGDQTDYIYLIMIYLAESLPSFDPNQQIGALESTQEERTIRTVSMTVSVDKPDGRSAFPYYSIFNYDTVPDKVMMQPAFFIEDKQELCIELSSEDEEFLPATCGSCGHAEAKAEIHFLDQKIQASSRPAEYLTNRLELGNKRCRVYWKLLEEEHSEATRKRDGWQAFSFLIPTKQAGGAFDLSTLIKTGFIDPTLAKKPPA